MQYQKECECCGNIITAYTHRLNTWLINALQKLVNEYKKTGLWCKIAELNLTTTQYNNFQKLQYFRLVYRIDGIRTPTEKAILFLDGKIPIYPRVATMGKDILWLDHPARQTDHSMPTRKYVYEIDWNYKRREEYQEEKEYQVATLF